MAKNTQTNTPVCKLCGQSGSVLIPEALVRNAITDQIRKQFPDWKPDGYICGKDLNRFRMQYIEFILTLKKGELNSLDWEVVNSLKQHDPLTCDTDLEFEKDLTFGERLSDKITTFGGSWKYIIIFNVILLIWIVINSTALLKVPFDPYPYIFLNLILSCLSAIQAPVIMMSQNRLEAKDRLRSQHDYQINLKAELEIRHLHEKIDHLLTRQWEKLGEIQQSQVDLSFKVSSHQTKINV